LEITGPSVSVGAMTMKRWGRGLFIWGLAGLVLSLAPAFILTTLLPQLDRGVIGIMGVLLAVSLAPLAALVLSVGVILLLVAAVRRDPY
jgi:hypothetical protein